MTPYRARREVHAAWTHRLGEPIGSTALAWTALLLSVGLAAGIAAYWRHEPLRGESLRWLASAAFVSASVGLSLIVWSRRAEAWIVLMPAQERVRVVRLVGFGVHASTLRLSRSMTVDYTIRAGRTWIALVDAEGGYAPILPATGGIAGSAELSRLEATLAALTSELPV